MSTIGERDDLYNAKNEKHGRLCTETQETNQYELMLTQKGQMLEYTGTDSDEYSPKFNESMIPFPDNSSEVPVDNYIPDLVKLINPSEVSLDFSERNLIDEYETESCQESNYRGNSFLKDLWWNERELYGFELELENMEINVSELNEMESINIMGELLAKRRKQRVREKQISGFYFNFFTHFSFLVQCVHDISLYQNDVEEIRAFHLNRWPRTETQI